MTRPWSIGKVAYRLSQLHKAELPLPRRCSVAHGMRARAALVREKAARMTGLTPR